MNWTKMDENHPRIKRFREKETSLKLRLDAQFVGIHNHVRHVQERHRDIERNTRRAEGHLKEAIKLALKLRRLYQQWPKS